MATISHIGIINRNGSVSTVHCHWDGYPSHNGKILLKNYNTSKKVRALLSKGNISSLAHSIRKPRGHTFDTRVEGYTVFYGRDRGKTEQEALNHENVKSALRECDECYTYLFDTRIDVKSRKQINQWKFRRDRDESLVILTEKDCSED